MRVLWLCNTMPPMFAGELGIAAGNKEGWISGMLARLLNDANSDLELGICFPLSGFSNKKKADEHYISGGVKGIKYYAFLEDLSRLECYDEGLEPILQKITSDF